MTYDLSKAYVIVLSTRQIDSSGGKESKGKRNNNTNNKIKISGTNS